MPDQHTASPVNVERFARTTNYIIGDLDMLAATVRYQGGWIVRCEMADSFTSQRVATREYAESLAMRHALKVAA